MGSWARDGPPADVMGVLGNMEGIQKPLSHFYICWLKALSGTVLWALNAHNLLRNASCYHWCGNATSGGAHLFSQIGCRRTLCACWRRSIHLNKMRTTNPSLHFMQQVPDKWTEVGTKILIRDTNPHLDFPRFHIDRRLPFSKLCGANRASLGPWRH